MSGRRRRARRPRPSTAAAVQRRRRRRAPQTRRAASACAAAAGLRGGRRGGGGGGRSTSVATTVTTRGRRTRRAKAPARARASGGPRCGVREAPTSPPSCTRRSSSSRTPPSAAAASSAAPYDRGHRNSGTAWASAQRAWPAGRLVGELRPAPAASHAMAAEDALVVRHAPPRSPGWCAERRCRTSLFSATRHTLTRTRHPSRDDVVAAHRQRVRPSRRAP